VFLIAKYNMNESYFILFTSMSSNNSLCYKSFTWKKINWIN